MKEWNFVKVEKNGLIYFSIPSFENTALVKHCFTSRIGGVSQTPYDNLNLGNKTKDKYFNVVNNYKKICDALEISTSDIVISDQVHKDNILIVEKHHKSNKLYLQNNKYSEIDALITNKNKIALTTIYADCVPIFILDKKKKVIALAHAGWKGTVKKIGKKTINTMINEFGSKPEDCIVGIGPSIGQCCYEVDVYVIDKFNSSFKNTNEFIIKKSKNKYMLDLWKANNISLQEMGIPEENITISNICTKCNNKLFYSYRAENGKTGRMAAILQLV